MFPYAPKVYRDYLRASPRLPDTIRVSGKVPAKRDATTPLITIKMVPAGPSPKPRILAWRRLIFQTTGGDDITVGERAELIRDLVVDSVYARIGVHRVNIVGEPALLYDPDDATPIGQLTVDALFRAKL